MFCDLAALSRVATSWPATTFTVWLTLAITMYFLLLRSKKDDELAGVKAKKAATKHTILKNAVFFEEERLANAKAGEAAKDDDKDDKDKKKQLQLQQRRQHKKNKKGAKDSKSTTTTTSSSGFELEDKPPAADKLLALVFDDVEREPVTSAMGIPSDDPWFLRVLAMYYKRLDEELREAAAKTLQGQELVRSGASLRSEGSRMTAEETESLDFADGSRLAKLIDFARDVGARVLGKKAVRSTLPRPAADGRVAGASVKLFDEAYLAAPVRDGGLASLEKAEAALRQVREMHRSANAQVWDLVRPALPVFLLAMFLDLLGRAFEAPLWAATMPAIHTAVARINPNATAPGEHGFSTDIIAETHHQVVIFFVMFAFSRPIDILANKMMSRARSRFAGPLRGAVMQSLLSQDTEYFDLNPKGVLQERLNSDTREVVDNALERPKRLIMHTFRVIQRSVTLYLACPAIFWAAFSFNVPLFSAIIILSRPRLRKLYGKMHRAHECNAQDTVEILTNVKAVRQFVTEDLETKKFVNANVIMKTFQLRMSSLTDMIHLVHGIMHHVGEIYIIVTCLYQYTAGQVSLPEAMICSTVGMWLQHDFKDVLEQVPHMLKVMKPLRRVAAILASQPRIECDTDDNNKSEQKNDNTTTTTAHEDEGEGETRFKSDDKMLGKSKSKSKKVLLRPKDGIKGEIVFKDVDFTYPKERQVQVLRKLSWSTTPGTKVAFVGPTGCGKSTSMNLLQRFYDRTGGMITIDGQPIEDYDVHFLRRQCGVVSQDTELFARSIYENIVYGMANPPAPDSEEFISVCKKAQAWKFIQKFPEKQFTVVGDNGARLSGGQKQRVAIARVMVRKPRLLFLDEATSALDAISEKAVQKALDDMLAEFNGVAIVIAHRLTTIKNCDKIVVMGDDGSKIEEGTHDDLMAKPVERDEDGKAKGSGLYRELWNTQQGKAAEKDNDDGGDRGVEESKDDEPMGKDTEAETEMVAAGGVQEQQEQQARVATTTQQLDHLLDEKDRTIDALRKELQGLKLFREGWMQVLNETSKQQAIVGQEELEAAGPAVGGGGAAAVCVAVAGLSGDAPADAAAGTRSTSCSKEEQEKKKKRHSRHSSNKNKVSSAPPAIRRRIIRSRKLAAKAVAAAS